ncbi:hypothetical protein [Bdellovibrio sp. NC01]|uniref:hypothetical protein n=1 Tax=Bdellovibrio sp. NC01 TaxID=2220073 RepID=UPI00115837F2|nr:hypothetical protein [Bdellovibrio sp. NC01]QDK37761.1 hypothetical protein DOE51_09285 [Bdellovibrio sp. NC01]
MDKNKIEEGGPMGIGNSASSPQHIGVNGTGIETSPEILETLKDTSLKDVMKGQRVETDDLDKDEGISPLENSF